MQEEVDSFLLTKHRLEQLDYGSYNFDKNSLPLINRLLSDLISATDAAKKFKSKLDIQVTESENWKQQLDPLRSQLSKITNENNKLHKDILTLNCTATERDRRNQQLSKKQQDEYEDLKFVNSQLRQTIVNEKEKHEKFREKIEETLTRQGIITEKPKKNKPPLFNSQALQKLQKIDIETGLEKMDDIIDFPEITPIVCDLVKLSEQKVEMVEKDLFSLKNQNSSLENELSLLQDKIVKKDQEIQRLGIQLEISRSQQWGGSAGVGGSVDLLTSGSSLEINDLGLAKRRIDQLEMQLEQLQEHIQLLEADISKFEEEKKLILESCDDERKLVENDLEQEKIKNGALLKNLSKLEIMVSDLDRIKNSSSPMKNKLKNSYSNQENSLQPNNASQPISKNIRQLSELQSKLRTCQENLKIKNERIESVKLEKTKLSEENNLLKNKVIELEKKNATVLEKKKATLIPKPTVESNFQSSIPVPTNSNVKKLEGKLKTLEEEKLTMESTIKTMLTEKNSDKNLLNERVLEINLLNNQLENFKYVNAESHKKQLDLESSLKISENEQKKLVEALEKFEDFLSQINVEVEIVTSERDNLSRLYQQVNDQLVQSRKVSNPEIIQTSIASIQTDEDNQKDIERNNEIKELNNLNKDLLDTNNSLKNENNYLKLELKKTKDDIEKQLYRQEETGSSALEAIKQLETERDGLKMALDSKERDMLLLVDNCEALEKHIKRMKEDIESFENREDNLKIKYRQLEVEKEKEVFKVRQLKSKISELEGAKERNYTELERIKIQFNAAEDQILKQKEMLEEVDRERDLFLLEMDQKDEILNEINDKYQALDSEKSELEAELKYLKDLNENFNQNLNDLEYELKTLRLSCENLTAEKDQLNLESSRNAEEAKNVSSDLVVVARENQILHQSIQEITNERDKTKDELIDMERYLHNLEDNFNNNEHEKENLFNSYRKLISDFEKLDINFKAKLEEENNLRMEVLMREKRIDLLQKSIEEVGAELNQYKIDLRAYEKQTTLLTRSLATAERTISNLEKEKTRLSREVLTTRDLTTTIDKSKEEVQSQLLTLKIENENLLKELKNFETEFEDQNKLIQLEKQRSEKFEQLLNSERKKNIQAEKDTKDLEFAKNHFDQQIQKLKSQNSIVLSKKEILIKEQTLEIEGLRSRVASLIETVEKQKNEIQELNKKATVSISKNGTKDNETSQQQEMPTNISKLQLEQEIAENSRKMKGYESQIKEMKGKYQSRREEEDNDDGVEAKTPETVNKPESKKEEGETLQTILDLIK
ncbi:hypothetical protein HDU92_002277 [Lobulomyces angularis]|nr:hypothetical protein HDU92_002277 [Lobulomyces angularis]